jgi:outer membrane protein OmpA-like peptidoglycan-associated protein
MNDLAKRIALICLFIYPLFSIAQNKDSTNAAWRPVNMVVNYSFEAPLDTANPVKLYNLLDKLQGWTSPNQSKPKVYASDAKGNIHDPAGGSWPFKARTGIQVGGIEVTGEKREYLQGSLTTPLIVGKKYYFAFWVHYHCSGANNIGIAFLPSKIAMDSTLRLPFKPTTYQKNMLPYSNDAKSTWAMVRDSFIAQMPYQSFVIGNFFTDAETELQKGRYNHFFAYIDDVAVWEARIQPTTDITTKEQKEEWQRNIAIVTPKNVPITLKDIYFDYNSANLDARSMPTLDSLTQKLRLVNTMKIHIIGHTSSEGSDDFNLKLSENRAAAVKNYLIAHGIEKERLSSEGIGEKKPIAPNDAEESRKINRRVEFIRTE